LSTYTPCAGLWTDAVVLYDHEADQWVISRFANNPDGFGIPNWYQCFAVSQTGDPTGAYYRYAFPIHPDDFPDYPKLGIWPAQGNNAYFMTARRRSAAPNLLGPKFPSPPAPTLAANPSFFPPTAFFVRNSCTYQNDPSD